MSHSWSRNCVESNGEDTKIRLVNQHNIELVYVYNREKAATPTLQEPNYQTITAKWAYRVGDLVEFKAFTECENSEWIKFLGLVLKCFWDEPNRIKIDTVTEEWMRKGLKYQLLVSDKKMPISSENGLTLVRENDIIGVV